MSCYGLYTPDSNCKEPQKILQSMLIGYGVFLLMAFVFIPFIFYSGGLAVIARVWRNDVGIVNKWMSHVTSKAHKLTLAKFDEG